VGGGGRDYVSYALAIETVARSSATLATILIVNNSLVGEVLARFGSDAQKTLWQRPLAAGQATGAFALSEEHAGTDAANVEMTAVEVDGGSAYSLTGRKIWVANAEGANVLLVFAATRPGMRAHGITAFLVPMSTPGIDRTARADSLGVRGLGCMDLAFTGVRVPADHVVGAVNDGFKVAMWALEGGRVAIAAQALGIGEAALEEALRHAKARQTFGKPIAEYGAIQFMLADVATGRCRPHAHAQGRGAQVLPGEHRAGGGAGEARGVHRRAEGRGHGDADPGVGRVPEGVEGRAALP
jgi:alkylation response protein AidB-like acyl-CoA dehydrogenase